MTHGSLPTIGSENDRHISLFPSSECIAWLTVLIIESVAIVTLNFLTIIVFIRNRSLRKRSMYLVINLAVADMLVGGFSEVLWFVQIGHGICKVWRLNVTSYTGIWYKIISFGIWHLFPAASLINLAAISLERMHATFRPFKHRVIKNWVIGVVIAVTWVTAGLVSTVLGIFTNISLIVHSYIRCSVISICLFIIFVSYTSILVKVYCGAHPQHHGAGSRERKLTKTLFIVTLVSSIVFLPTAVLAALYLDTDTITSITVVVCLRCNCIFIVLFCANSLANPILYTIRMPEFRRALFSLFERHHRQVQVEIPLRVTPGN